MSGETVYVANASGEITLEANGASTVEAAFTQADDANLTTADVDGYPMLDIEFSGTYATAPTIGSFVHLYAQPLNFESTNDQTAPQADFPHTYVTSFPLNDVTTTQYSIRSRVPHPCPRFDCAFWIKNSGGQTLSAGWTLKATATAYNAAA